MAKHLIWLAVLGLVAAESIATSAQLTSQVAIRMVLFTLSVIGCGLFVGAAWKKPERRWLFVAPISWMMNLGAFYLCRLAGWPADVYAVNTWSQVIHLHALILLIGGLILYERT